MSHHRPTRRTLSLETLENRQLMAADVGDAFVLPQPGFAAPEPAPQAGPETYLTASMSHGWLTIEGSIYDDHVSVTRNANGTYRVTMERFDDGDSLGVQTVDFAAAPIQFLGQSGGDDTFLSYVDASQLYAFGGAGNDRFAQYGSTKAVFFGNLGNDNLRGGFGADELHGGEGADRIDGFYGNDLIRGGGGNDNLFGGQGNDTIYGDAGADFIYGGVDHDRLYGGDDNDVMRGEDGNDNLYGGRGNDSLDGGNGSDRLEGDAGYDSLRGGHGNDLLKGGDDNDVLEGQQGDDYLYGQGGADVLYGDDPFGRYSGKDYLDGGYEGAVDYLFGGYGADTFVRHKRLYGWDPFDQLDDFDSPEGDQLKVVTNYY
jgi:Ca2+-binding RTX toxin-like protein